MTTAHKPTVYFVAKSRNDGKLLFSLSDHFPTAPEFSIGTEFLVRDKPVDDVWTIVFIFAQADQETLRKCEARLTDPDDPTNAADLWARLGFIMEIMMNLDRPQNQQTSDPAPE